MDDPLDQHSMHLVHAARGGDDAALDKLLRKHLPDLRVFIRAKTSEKIRAQESCSDLVQTVCREALGGLDGYEWQGEGSFRHWLFSVALNKIRNRADYYAAAKRNTARGTADDEALAHVYESLCGPSQFAIANEAVARFEANLDRLPEESREVILLSRVVGLDHGEIAEKLGIQEGAVRVRLSRGLSRLATLMAQSDSDPG